jgi:hypothetical protein
MTRRDAWPTIGDGSTCNGPAEQYFVADPRVRKKRHFLPKNRRSMRHMTPRYVYAPEVYNRPYKKQMSVLCLLLHFRKPPPT